MSGSKNALTHIFQFYLNNKTNYFFAILGGSLKKTEKNRTPKVPINKNV